MKPFLKQVADHYMNAGSISGRCFIFPNRRSQVFFTKYLGEAVQAAGEPVVAPGMLTINDFFAKISGAKVPDKVTLLLELHDCYKALYDKAEPLDEFIFWGDVILADFDDVDKYLVDPEQLYTNVAEFKGMQDSYSYLTENQRTAIENFVRHFREGGRLTVRLDSKDPNVKERFLQVWQILLPLYRNFRKTLSSHGMSYEGMVYRGLAERLEKEPVSDVLDGMFPASGGFVFVGLNALNACERRVMGKMRDAGRAEFCWDFSGNMLRDSRNHASFFMKRNVEEFPQAFELDPEGLVTPEIEVVSVPSSIGQAKLLDCKVKDDEYAVVLPDESLLIPLLNSIPPAIADINVTMGYPMKSSSFFDFMSLVSAMQLHLRQKDGKWYFYHKQVWSILSSGLFQEAVKGDAGAQDKVKAIKSGARYYIPQEDLNGNDFFDLLFKPVVQDPKSTAAAQVNALEDYQLDLIHGLARRLAKEPETAIELEFARKACNAINLLKKKTLEMLPLTYTRLLNQLMASVSVPFDGEPLKGLQIMGPLETRALDFKKVVILSCNEGVFPRRNVSSSFIPPELRKGFGLPTCEFQDAIWAYYFYRLIQRAESVTLVYDSRTEGLKSGEESRFIKQLEYHFNLPLRRSFVKSEAKVHVDRTEIGKTEADVARLREVTLSASSLKSYLDCPAMFYYSKVVGLKEVDEVAQDLDAGMIGNVYHSTMQALYMGERAMDPAFDMGARDLGESFPDALEVITKEYVSSWLKRSSGIKERVRSLILSELRTLEISGRNLVMEAVIVQYVMKTLQRDKELMERYGVGSFRIVGLEKLHEMTFDGFKFVGFIDRMDSFLPGELRIVDYKTGKVEDKDVDIDDANASLVVEQLFGEDNRKRPKIAFQLFLYDVMASSKPEALGQTLVNAIYQPARLFTEGVRNVPMCKRFNDQVAERLHGLLARMADVHVGWTRTKDLRTCSWCSFKTICGR